MPSPPKYPLEPLLEHRERLVEDAEAALARAVSAREAAERAEAAAVAARDVAVAHASQVRAAEAARVERGEARAADLAQAGDWERAEAARMVELGRRVEDARTQLRGAREAEARARTDLAAKKADHDVVVKDQAKFTDARRRAAESREEEEAAEAWGGRPGAAGAGRQPS